MNARQSTFTDWLHLIQAEYLEIPGLHLTMPQAQRLWGLDSSLCETLLDALVAADFLKRTRGAAYVLTESSRTVSRPEHRR